MGALGLTGTGAAQGPPPGAGGGPPDDRGGPPEKCDCPEETFLAKYEFVDDNGECYFELDEGEDVISITDWESKDGEACEPVTVYYEADGYDIQSICSFGGTDTHTDEDPDGTYESDLTNPGGDQAAISNITFCGEEEEDEEEEEALCSNLSGEYECTIYDSEESGEEIINYVRTSTRVFVTNSGPVGAMFSLALADSPGDFREGIQIGADTTTNIVADASFPFEGLLAWEVSEECIEQEEFQTWGEYKEELGIENLTEWYEMFGMDSSPGEAPEDFDDGLAVQVLQIPEDEKGNEFDARIGPDENIDPNDYPDMSADAEAEGWITCGKLDMQQDG